MMEDMRIIGITAEESDAVRVDKEMCIRDRYNAVKTALSTNDTSSVMKLNDGIKEHDLLDAVEIKDNAYPVHNLSLIHI